MVVIRESMALGLDQELLGPRLCLGYPKGLFTFYWGHVRSNIFSRILPGGVVRERKDYESVLKMPSFETGRNVFVTGASGVLGRRIVSLLGRLQPSWTVIPVGVDLRDVQAVSAFCDASVRPDMLIHLAAIVPTGRVNHDPLSAYEVNSVGAGRIFQAMLSVNPELWGLYVSSSHVYAPSDYPLTEASEIRPASAYGRTKLAGEFSVTDVFDGEGRANLCIARVFSMYSPDQDRSFLYPGLLSLKKDPANFGKKVPVHGWDNVRDFLHADAVADYLVRLVSTGAAGLFNIGSGLGRSVASFASEVVGINPDLVDELKSENRTSLVANVSKLRSHLDGL